jgi:hypothetical protein
LVGASWQQPCKQRTNSCRCCCSTCAQTHGTHADAAALLSLKTGQLLLVTLRFEGVKAANKMQVAVVGSAPVASCAVRLTSDLLFLGSATGDALLVRHSGTAGGTAFAGRGAGGSASGGSGLAAQPSAKRRRTSFLASYDMGGWEGGGASLAAAGSLATGASRRLRSSSSAGSLVDLQYNDNSDLYRSAMGRSSSAKLPALAGDASRLLLSVLDSLQCLGPMRSTALTDLHLCHSFIQTSLAGAPPADSDNKPRPCLLAAVGSDKSGALALLRRGLVADVVAAVPALSVHGAWSLHHWDPPGSSRAGGEAGADADEAGSRAQAGSGPAPWQHFHKFLLLSCTDEYGSKTMLMDVGTETLNQITTDDVSAGAWAAWRVYACVNVCNLVWRRTHMAQLTLPCLLPHPPPLTTHPPTHPPTGRLPRRLRDRRCRRDVSLHSSCAGHT